MSPVTHGRRHPLSLAALTDLAERTGTPLPWAAAQTSWSAHALAPQMPAAPAVDPGALTRLGLVSDDDRVDVAAATALAVFAAPEAFVDVELGVRRTAAPGGVARLRSWHRVGSGLVAAVTTAGPDLELAWWPEDRWPAELARLVTPRRLSPGPAPAAPLRLPFELLLGAARAVREDRPAVLAELVGRSGGRVRGPGRAAYDDAGASEQVRLVHSTERGRLRIVVTGRGILGLVSWVLFADGWRELAPTREHGEAMVELRPVRPADLGAAVARLLRGGG